MSRTAPRLVLVDFMRGRLELAADVDAWARRSVCVLVHDRGRVEFPHLASDGGELLGDDDLYAQVRERARELSLLLGGRVYPRRQRS